MLKVGSLVDEAEQSTTKKKKWQRVPDVIRLLNVRLLYCALSIVKIYRKSSRLTLGARGQRPSSPVFFLGVDRADSNPSIESYR